MSHCTSHDALMLPQNRLFQPAELFDIGMISLPRMPLHSLKMKVAFVLWGSVSKCKYMYLPLNSAPKLVSAYKKKFLKYSDTYTLFIHTAFKLSHLQKMPLQNHLEMPVFTLDFWKFCPIINKSAKLFLKAIYYNLEDCRSLHSSSRSLFRFFWAIISAVTIYIFNSWRDLQIVWQKRSPYVRKCSWHNGNG